MKGIWPLIVVPILIVAPFVWYFADDLFGGAEFGVGETVRVVADNRAGTVRKVHRVDKDAPGGQAGGYVYLVWYLDDVGHGNALLDHGGKWCRADELERINRSLPAQ